MDNSSHYLQLLVESSDAVKGKALQRLEPMLDNCWALAADFVQQVQELYHNPDFEHRNLAALVASKIFYHLEDHRMALDYALKAGEHFNMLGSTRSEYIETMVSEALDRFIEEKDAGTESEPSLVNIIDRMFDRCIETEQFEDAVAMVMETKLINKLGICLDKGGEPVLDYALDLATTIVTENNLRQEVLLALLDGFQKLPQGNKTDKICWIYYLLDRPEEIAKILLGLMDTDNGCLAAFQVAFQLYTLADGRFLAAVLDCVSGNNDDAIEAYDGGQEQQKPSQTAQQEKPAEAKAPEPMDIDAKQPKKKAGADMSDLEKLCSILNGTKPAELTLAFLYSKNQVDLDLYKKLKQGQKKDLLNQSVLDSYAIATTGTTANDFVVSNMKWLGDMEHFSKFSAVAGFGATSTGHFSTNVLEAYLQDAGPYAMGGAFFARGIIHSRNRGESREGIRKEMIENLGRTTSEIVQHGICLALGITEFMSCDQEMVEQISGILMSDHALAGFAAGLSMGMVMAGSGDEDITQRVYDHACDTQHGHIQLGCSLGLAMLQIGRQSAADEWIDKLLAEDTRPQLRVGGCYSIGLAYAGQNDSGALKKLLHFAVSDVDDNVRTAAVMNIGLLLCNKPDRVANVVDLLARSFNLHTRYGACAAIGAACAGQGGGGEAARLLRRLRKDEADYVRQGANIASGFLYGQSSTSTEEMKKEADLVAKKMLKTATNKHSGNLTRQGAILGLGVKGAGGQNLQVELVTEGIVQLKAVASMALFWTFSQWFPLIHFLPFCFRPSCVMGLDRNLEMPNIEFQTDAPASHFAYVEKVKKNTEKLGELKKAVLTKAKSTQSVIALAEAEEEKKDSKEMDVDEKVEDVKTEEKKAEETKNHVLKNPSRVTVAQRKHVIGIIGDRYEPVFHSKSLIGVVMLQDKKPTEPTDYVETKVSSSMGVAPPADFKYIDPLEYNKSKEKKA